MAERYGKGTVERVGGLWVLHLRGTSFERGLQHGTLMRYRVGQTINFYRTLPEVLAGRAVAPDSYRMRGLLRMKKNFARHFMRNRDADALEETRGLAVGLGMREGELAEALVLADVFAVFSSYAERRRRTGPPVIPGLGCTSVVRKTADEMFYCRNFDFWGPGYWDSNPAVIFHHPDKGKAFCSIATAGMPTGGITSINEDGIAVAIHQHGSRDSSLAGTPVIDIAHDITRNASSVEEAIRISGRHRASGGWTIMVAGGGDAAAIEMSSAAQRPRRMSEDLLVATNCFLDEGLSSREIQANVSSTISDKARFKRAMELASSPRTGPAGMAAILADHYDTLAARERPAGFTISRITNISSVLFSLGDRRFWVSEGSAPASRGGFVGFDLDAELAGRKYSLGRLEGARPPSAKVTAAQARYLDAYKHYIYAGDLNQVHAILDDCINIDASEPTFHLMQGIVRAMLGNHRGGLDSIERALEAEQVEQKRPVERLWRARVLDLLDRRAEAVEEYSSMAEDDTLPLPILKASRRGLRKAFREKGLSNLLLDFTNGDTLE